MRLCGLISRFIASLLTEGYGKTAKFDYENWHNDPTPHVLQLGHWVHPTTGNTLIAGINLNYLSNDQVDALRYYLPDILSDRNLKVRYHSGKRLLPDVFGNFYRTYDRKHVNVVEPGSLSFMKPDELDSQGDQERARKLQQRRSKLAQLKSQQAAQRGQPPPEEAPPEAIPGEEPTAPGPIGGPPSQEAGVPENPQTPQDRAREAVKSQQAQRMISRIDDKLRQRLEAPPIPPPPQPIGPPEPPPVQPPLPRGGGPEEPGAEVPPEAAPEAPPQPRRQRPQRPPPEAPPEDEADMMPPDEDGMP